MKHGASIGAGAVIGCGVTIGAYALVGAGSMVTQDVPAHALVHGNPAHVRGFVCKCGSKLEKEKTKHEAVVMQCPLCGEKFKIPTENYALIVK